MKIPISGFEYVKEDSGCTAVIVCKICGERINNKEHQGMVFWNIEKPDQEAVIAHKECMAKIKNNRSDYPSSEELSHYFYYVLYNSKIEPKEPRFE